MKRCGVMSNSEFILQTISSCTTYLHTYRTALLLGFECLPSFILQNRTLLQMGTIQLGRYLGGSCMTADGSAPSNQVTGPRKTPVFPHFGLVLQRVFPTLGWSSGWPICDKGRQFFA